MTTIAPDLQAEAHRFESDGRPHLFLVRQSQIFEIDEALDQILAAGGPDAIDHLAEFGATPVAPPIAGLPPLRAVALAVSQACNLGCSYCYAQGGAFGGASKAMPLEVAKQAVELLLADSEPGSRISVVFLGGEPLANRPILRATTGWAKQRAAEMGVEVSFSITTNGTLVCPDDARFLADYGFQVTVSIDGTASVQNAQRPFRDGRPSHERVLRGIDHLTEALPPGHLHARSTVIAGAIDLPSALEDLARVGFQSIGFSPMLRSPSGLGELRADDLQDFLGQMIVCAREFEQAILSHRPHPFANARSALAELHRGSHRPLPCGAAAGYLGVSAEGGLYACHRFNEDPSAAFGTVWEGRDASRNLPWLQERQVDKQEPCRSCWARYLCGGGCHHEVMERGRPACDYIRGWLEHCLGMYSRVVRARPDYFRWN